MQSDYGEHLLRIYGGILCLDATHKTNRDGKQLYTLVVQLDSRRLAPAAFLLLGEDDEDHLAVGLWQIQQRVGTAWRVRVVMMDDATRGMLKWYYYGIHKFWLSQSSTLLVKCLVLSATSECAGSMSPGTFSKL